MSEIAAPSTPETAATPEAAPVELPAKVEKTLHGRAALKAKLAAKADDVFNDIASKRKPVAPEAPEPATPSSETTSPETAEAVAKIEEITGEEVPAPKPNETKVQYETKIAKLLLQVQRAEAEGLKHKKSNETLTSELNELKAKLAEASSDPVKALKLANMTPDQMAQAMIDGKLTRAEEKQVEQKLPPEVLELIEEAKNLKAEKAEREAEAARTKAREKQVGVVSDAKTAVLDKYPSLDLVPNERLLDAYLAACNPETGEEPDFDSFAAKMQENIVAEVASAVAHKGTLKALLAAKPELKDALVEALGLKSAGVAPAVETAPAVKTLGKVTPEVPVRSGEMSVAERKARQNAAAARVFGG